MTPIVLRMLSDRWHHLQEENAPLRAVVNGRVRSVDADFYDDCLRRALPMGRKKVARLIGEILGREQPAWRHLLANRLRVLLERGEFRMVQEDPQFTALW